MHDLAHVSYDASPVRDWSALRSPDWSIARDDAAGAVAIRKGARAWNGPERLGFALPGPNMASTVGDMTVLWQGPQEWLVLLPRDEAAAATGRFAAALADETAIVADVSGRLLLLGIGGDAHTLLSHGTGIDLARLQNGHLARTRFANLPVTLLGGAQGIHLVTDRVHEPGLHAWFSGFTPQG